MLQPYRMKPYTLYTAFAVFCLISFVFAGVYDLPERDPIIEMNRKLDDMIAAKRKYRAEKKKDARNLEEMLSDDETMFGNMFDIPDDFFDDLLAGHDEA